jgi:hypothetical protein
MSHRDDRMQDDEPQLSEDDMLQDDEAEEEIEAEDGDDAAMDSGDEGDENGTPPGLSS